jgi:hypothetical protein
MTQSTKERVSNVLSKATTINSAARRSGTEVVSTKLRKEALAALGALYRALMKIGISDRHEDILASIEEDIKTCDSPAEMIAS